jgi:ATP-binding cassette, subfamily B, multidrug efflux pump
MMSGWMMGGSTGAQRDEEVFGSVYNPRVVRRMLGYIKPYRKELAIAVLSVFVFTASMTAVPWIIKIAIDDYIAEGNLGGLWWVVGAFMGIAVVNWAANYVQQIAMERVGQGLLYGLRRDMFAHLQRQSVSFFDRTEAGRLISRIIGDVGQMQEMTSIVVMTLADFVSLVFIVGALLALDVRLGLISMATLPVLAFVVIVWQPFAKREFLKVRRAISIVNADLNENLSGVRVVQAMNRQQANLDRFEGKNHDHLQANMVASKWSAGLLPSVDILTGVAMGLVVFFGSGMVSGGAIEVGVLIASLLYVQRFFDPVRSLTMQYTQLQRSMTSGARIFDLLDAEPDMADAPDAIALPPIKGRVEFRDVGFSYDPGVDVLTGVSFVAKAGETIAVVGPSGAGKTTMVSLLSRFADIEEGRGGIKVDGHDLRDVTRASLVTQMSMVLQEPFLFSGSVRDNIKFNHPDVTDDQMVTAADAVGAHEFIVALPNGYDTEVAELGVNLSLGQRQLVSFARAIVSEPKILILDEATASVDSETELKIQKALGVVLEGRTAIVIAHRLSTVRDADRILVMDDGHLVQEGNHETLLAAGGRYAQLHRANRLLES